MNHIDELVARLCPGGVEHRPLGEVGEFIRGSGLQKKDFVEEGVGCIHYGQVYTSYGTATSTTRSFVTPDLASRLKKARPGDLVVATTSENATDVAKAVAWLGAGEIAISGDASLYRHRLDPMYAAYLFQSADFTREKRPYVNGTKVKRIAGKDLARIRVPVPPMEIQREVAAVLERAETLEAELKAELEDELEARTTQYAHYRDLLLDFSRRPEIRVAAIGDLGQLYGGLTGKSKADFGAGNARYISYVNVLNNPRTELGATEMVAVAEEERQRSVVQGDVLFTASSEGPDDVGLSSVVPATPAEPVYLNSFCFGLRFTDPSLLDRGFTTHLFRSAGVRRQIVRTANGVTRFNISKARFLSVAVPIPPLEEQRRVAEILDKFETLVGDLSTGLPAEIAARQAQYEYYRDRLLTFPGVS